MRKRFLLIGWDAADWNFLNPLMDSGELPALNAIVENGVAGKLLATQPLNAAAIWTSIVTGKRPWQHGVVHSREFDSARQQQVPISGNSRRCRSLWEMLAERELKSIVVGWPATHGTNSKNPLLVSDRYSEPTAPPGIKPWPPARAGTCSNESLGAALDPLRVSPEEIGADVIRQFVPNWQRVDQKRDRRLSQLRALLSVDFSHFNAIQFLLQHHEWDFAAIRFSSLGHIVRSFLPFQAPQREWISPGEFELYRDVVNAECRLLDQSLAALQELAGSDTAIMLVSAHGTKISNVPPNGFPPGEDAWKSPFGVIAAAGPAFARDQLLHGASALDVTPTILNWFGLPIGDDMEGRVLIESFAEFPEVQRIPTWERDDNISRQNADECAATHLIAQTLQHESNWNLAQSFLEAGRFEQALAPLEKLFRAFPERAEFSHALFQCQLNLGRIADAEETLDVVTESVPSGPLALLPRAELALSKRDLRQARLLSQEIRKLNPTRPALLRRLGLLLLRLREWTALEELARAAVELEPDDPLPWLGLAEASLRRQKLVEAETAARRAIQLKYFLSDAHFILARALVAQNKWTEAREVMAGLMKLQPGNKTAQSYHRRISGKT
ncbi:MAG TPA: alkaline phosphatase family protein [Verrucomicrobiae bacterium]